MAFMLSKLLVFVAVCVALASAGPYPIILPFNCTIYSPAAPATDVTMLRPHDIKVIASLGDSIGAGFAMQGVPPEDLLEWRDYSYNIGVHPDAITVPNWLLKYNPALIGGATSVTLPLTKGKWLDASISEAKIGEVLDTEIDFLVNQMTKGPYKDIIDYENDWKLITLFIGANNICPSCHPGERVSTPEYFEDTLRQVLTKIESEIPKVFLNILTIFNISGVYHAGMTKEYCRILWSGITNGECGCLTTHNNTNLEIMDEHSVAFNAVTNKVALEFMANKTGSKTFQVSVQPGLQDINITHWGEGFLSDLDCFHPNLQANMAFTVQLWNNMWTPPGQKSTKPDLDDLKIKCPGPDTYIQ